MTSFWCKECRKDFDGPEEMVDNGMVKFFRGACPKNHKCIRYISNNKADPYFYESEKLKAQRAMLAKDLIQYGQDGFQTLYKSEWDKIQKTAEIAENKRIAWEAEKRKVYNEHKHNATEKNAIKKVLEREEQMMYGR